MGCVGRDNRCDNQIERVSFERRLGRREVSLTDGHKKGNEQLIRLFLSEDTIGLKECRAQSHGIVRPAFYLTREFLCGGTNINGDVGNVVK